MPIDILWQPTTSSSNLFYCPSCNALLEQANRRAQYVACGNCGAEIDVGLKSYEVIKQHDLPRKYESYSFIRLGQKAVINRKYYKVIGRQCWKIRYKQYVEIDGPNIYEEKIGNYDEWTLMGEDQTTLTLMEDGGSYYLKEKIIPETPMIMQGNLILRFFESHQKQIVRKHGKAVLASFEGEESKQIRIGQEKLLAFYNENGIFGVECDLEENEKTISRVSFYHLKEINPQEVFNAFLPNQLKDILKKQQRNWRLGMIALGVVAILMFWLVDNTQLETLGEDLYLPAMIAAIFTSFILLIKQGEVWQRVIALILFVSVPFYQLILGVIQTGLTGIGFLIAIFSSAFLIYALWSRKHNLIG